MTRADLWSTGYYPGWEQASLPASNLDFSALTHVIHFSVVPNANGTLNSSDNGVSPANSADLVSRAHAAGKKVLICVGGAGSESDFQAATSSGTLPIFISSLTNFLASRGYDGLDVDWEPLPSTDAGQFTNLIRGLRTALDGFTTHKLLTVAVGAYPPYGDSPTADYDMFAMLQNEFDQINLMTYDMSGPWSGWVTWFNSPIYDGGYHFPSSGALLPSINGAVSNYIAAGIAPARLGIGIAFYGYTWTGNTGTAAGGVTGPRQSWITAPTVTAVRYTTIMANYFQTNRYHWDSGAQAAYLSISNANPANDMFISYDDERTCQAKVSFARNHGLGGVMIWELAQDHQTGKPDPLLSALKQALASPGWLQIHDARPDVQLSFSSLPLGAYRVEWTDDLVKGAWSTLAITNISGPGGTLQVVDPNADAWTQRFYRVQTPP